MMRQASKVACLAVFSVVAALALMAGRLVWAQTATDPGVRGGAAGAGGFQTTLTSDEQLSFTPIKNQFNQTFVVCGNAGCNPKGTVINTGLGPRFSSNSCANCHAQPAPGGSSPKSNPLFSVSNANGATNTMPTFETTTGPVLVPRFPYQLNKLSVTDGTVHPLFTVAGRTDGGSCAMAQPNFTQAISDDDIVYRQPLPVFGDGYIEIVEDTSILNNLNSNLALKQSLGIGGVAQITDDGSISRLGWKAQWRAILPAVGAEENVEMGVTNDMFPTETDQSLSNCLLNPVPEDTENYAYWCTAGVTQGPCPATLPPTNQPWEFVMDADRNAIFIRFLAAPTPSSSCPAGGNCTNGQTQFNSVGCVLCHTTSYTTPAGSIPSMGHVTINLYSDLLLHHMGNCLADNITQGAAQGDMFRTPPLWNVGQRVNFMHDGRTNNIVTAIEDHQTGSCSGSYPPSEAEAVITQFNKLSSQNQQDLIDFLRSL
ncbi:MAG TPA: di-heme oxidoredictase family protein [Terriglobia bacterium]